MKLDITFEEDPWQEVLDTLRPGSALSVHRLLTLMGGEPEDRQQALFRGMEQRRIAIDLTGLPREYGRGDMEARLRLEEKLAASGKLPQGLEENDPLRLYLQELAATPAAGDPQVLGLELLEGRQEAAQALAGVCMHLAPETAYALTGHGVLLLDLIQEASLGLWEGILQYEGGDVEQHLSWWARQYAARAVVLQALEGDLGRKLRQGMEAVSRADRQLLVRLGRNPTVEELALELGITPEETQVYRDALDNASDLARMKEPKQDDPREEEQAVEDTALFQSRQRVAELLSGLTEREARLLSLRFGLEGERPLTAAEAGRKLGLTEQEAVALEGAALEKMRK